MQISSLPAIVSGHGPPRGEYPRTIPVQHLVSLTLVHVSRKEVGHLPCPALELSQGSRTSPCDLDSERFTTIRWCSFAVRQHQATRFWQLALSGQPVRSQSCSLHPGDPLRNRSLAGCGRIHGGQGRQAPRTATEENRKPCLSSLELPFME